MTEAFKAVPLADDVWWVGAIDWSLRDFHGYSTNRGTTYNAYLIVDEKITLIDTVKAPFVDEMLERIRSVVDPKTIDVVVSNHSEMDHSGGLPRTLEAVDPTGIFASAVGAKTLQKHFDLGREITGVKEGDVLHLGKRTLQFVETKMLHWPDSMFSMMMPDRLLFSQDAFGMHLASSERFADELDQAVLDEEASKYYANILLPLSPLVLKLLEKVKASGLEIATIAPDHGPVWRKDLDWIVTRYAKWAEQAPTRRAVVVFDTMWHSTEMLARAVGEGLAAGGARVKLIPLATRHRSDAITELLDAGALVVGSPTMNNQMFPTVADFLTYAKGLKPKNLIGAAFGSHGWSGEGAKHVRRELEEMKVELVGETLSCNYVPKDVDLAAARTLGETVAARLKEKCVG